MCPATTWHPFYSVPCLYWECSNGKWTDGSNNNSYKNIIIIVHLSMHVFLISRVSSRQVWISLLWPRLAFGKVQVWDGRIYKTSSATKRSKAMIADKDCGGIYVQYNTQPQYPGLLMLPPKMDISQGPPPTPTPAM